MIRKLLFLALLCGRGLVTDSALAKPPDPAYCTLGSNIPDPAKRHYMGVFGYGTTGGVRVPNASVAFEVTAKDGQPIPQPQSGWTVVADFSGCPDIQLSCDQLTPETGQTYLGGKRVLGYTNADGKFTFEVQGASDAVILPGTETSPGTSAGVACASVFVDGVYIGNVIARAYDVDGTGSPATTGADASIVAQESAKVLLGATSRARDDYTLDNHVDGADASAAAMAAATCLIDGCSVEPICP